MLTATAASKTLSPALKVVSGAAKSLTLAGKAAAAGQPMAATLTAIAAGAAPHEAAWLDRLLVPVCVAVFGALLALCTNFFMKTLENRARRRSIIRNAASTLDTYLDELRNGLDWMDQLIAQLEARKYPHAAALLLSRKSWDNFRLEADYRTELNLLHEQSVEGVPHPVGTLPIHLKNCFEYVTGNYQEATKSLLEMAATMHTVADWTTGGVGLRFGQVRGYRAAYHMTVLMTDAAVQRLKAKTTNLWWIERKLGNE